MAGGGSVGGGIATDAGTDGGSDGGDAFDAGAPVPGLDGGPCITVARSCAQAGPNLLLNSTFEIPLDGGPDGIEGILPESWLALQITPDTYTTAGGFGIDPTYFGNFTGVTAFSGQRWIAAWSFADERGGQQLSTPLVGGRRYLAEAWLHQAVRLDLDNPGTYVLMLAADAQQTDSVDVGSWCPTTAVDAGWVRRSFIFTAPPDAGALPWFNFRPVVSDGFGGAYPGLDDFTLRDVTACP